MNEITEDSVKSKFKITFERTFENCFCLFMALLIMAPFNNNEKLSELVTLYPCFYNKQEKDFKKEDIKQRAWNEIAKELNISNGKEAEQYWQNLKKLLSKRRCKLKEVDVSGASAGPINKTRKALEELKPLKPSACHCFVL